MVGNVQVIVQENQRPQRIALYGDRTTMLFGVGAVLDEGTKLPQGYAGIDDQECVDEHRDVAHADRP